METKKRFQVPVIVHMISAIFGLHSGTEDHENHSFSMSNGTNISVIPPPMRMPATDEFISQDSLRSLKFAFGMIIIPLLSLFGAIGNILSLVVLFQQRMRSATNFILAALSVSDLLFLMHSLLFSGINIQIYLNPFKGKNVRNIMYPLFGAYGSLVTARITSWLTALLSMERFIAVHFPMKAKRFCSKKHTLIGIFLICIFTIILFLPYALKYKVIEKTKRNKTYSILLKSDLGTNIDFFDVYGILMNILFRFLPIFVLLVLNSLIIYVVKKTWTRRQSMTSNSSVQYKHGSGEQSHITIMLMIVTFLFAACILPGALNSTATHIWTEYSKFGKARNLKECVSYITYFLETLNSSVNFLIYMALSKKFCVTYKETFCCKKTQKRSISWASYHSKERTMENRHQRNVTIASGSTDSKYFDIENQINMEPLRFLSNGHRDTEPK
ncbi:probable G-protein coupled receptor B0563.6 [Mizuhopecten yessoensis]|uniref:probable G-protein coupled receptor B0563.6 n=1 Tax=Mizuhopecten yessoensis TaxID=6573 RepID=UPI000B45DCB6|nr:probable G-protein coupled receptor B0563.6 [Mizuhopecten yessoensis]